MTRVNVITCATWVPRGFAKEDPEKVELSKEELEKIIKETKGEVEELEEAEYGKIEDDENLSVDVKNVKKEKKETDENKENIKKKKKAKPSGEDMEDIVSTYNLDDYDDDIETDFSLHLGMLTMHSSGDDDPLLTVKDNEDKDSDDGNNAILKTDNLIAVGHIDGDASILEVHVYNSEENSFYVHHDILLPAIPLCMEWLNYDPSEEKPGNLLAVGTMSNVIEVWDLDVVDILEPSFTLGSKGKKRKKLAGTGHKDAVLSLAWNKEYFHILASGSVDNTVILWDLKEGRVDRQLSCFSDKVQALQWHPSNPSLLLTGSCDKNVRLFDCRTENAVKSWTVDGEVECVQWNPTIQDQCVVSTDTGSVYCINTGKPEPLWNIDAHEGVGVTGLKMSPNCPGCLVTASVDTTIRIWDICGDKAKFVEEHEPKLGLITTLTTCPDEPFVFFMGGDNQENNLKVLDIRSLGSEVRSTFCERIGLPVDEEMEDEDSNAAIVGLSYVKITDVDEPQSIVEEQEEKGWKPKKSKFTKKKGGHLDRIKKKR